MGMGAGVGTGPAFSGASFGAGVSGLAFASSATPPLPLAPSLSMHSAWAVQSQAPLLAPSLAPSLAPLPGVAPVPGALLPGASLVGTSQLQFQLQQQLQQQQLQQQQLQQLMEQQQGALSAFTALPSSLSQSRPSLALPPFAPPPPGAHTGAVTAGVEATPSPAFAPTALLQPAAPGLGPGALAAQSSLPPQQPPPQHLSPYLPTTVNAGGVGTGISGTGGGGSLPTSAHGSFSLPGAPPLLTPVLSLIPSLPLGSVPPVTAAAAAASAASSVSAAAATASASASASLAALQAQLAQLAQLTQLQQSLSAVAAVAAASPGTGTAPTPVAPALASASYSALPEQQPYTGFPPLPLSLPMPGSGPGMLQSQTHAQLPGAFAAPLSAGAGLTSAGSGLSGAGAAAVGAGTRPQLQMQLLQSPPQQPFSPALAVMSPSCLSPEQQHQQQQQGQLRAAQMQQQLQQQQLQLQSLQQQMRSTSLFFPLQQQQQQQQQQPLGTPSLSTPPHLLPTPPPPPPPPPQQQALPQSQPVPLTVPTGTGGLAPSMFFVPPATSPVLTPAPTPAPTLVPAPLMSLPVSAPVPVPLVTPTGVGVSTLFAPLPPHGNVSSVSGSALTPAPASALSSSVSASAVGGFVSPPGSTIYAPASAAAAGCVSLPPAPVPAHALAPSPAPLVTGPSALRPPPLAPLVPPATATVVVSTATPTAAAAAAAPGAGAAAGAGAGAGDQPTPSGFEATHHPVLAASQRTISSPAAASSYSIYRSGYTVYNGRLTRVPPASAAGTGAGAGAGALPVPLQQLHMMQQPPGATGPGGGIPRAPNGVSQLQAPPTYLAQLYSSNSNHIGAPGPPQAPARPPTGGPSALMSLFDVPDTPE
jgi:type II secretory pathway pseudopilin PulG